MAREVEATGDVVFVPALAKLVAAPLVLGYLLLTGLVG